MGKGGKAQTIGYKYYLGMHLGLCHGPVDAITRLTVDDRIAWSGTNTGGSITVAADSLFGGEKREGGVSGTIDVAMGGPAQGQNSYLVSKLGSLIPAYRGVVGLIFRQCYLGNNPYLKKWSVRAQRIHTRQNGIAQWYNSKSEISSGGVVSRNDVWQYQITSIFTSAPSSVPSTGWDNSGPAPFGEGSFSRPYAIRTNWPHTTGIWLRKTITVPATGAMLLHGHVENSCYIYLDGALIHSQNAGNSDVSSIQEFNIPLSGIGAGEHELAIYAADDTVVGNNTYIYLEDLIQKDLNPAHIIRECLTDPDWGMGYTDNDIDADSFEDSADTFYDEGLGMSLLWDRQIKIEDFVQTVLRHVDAVLYVSRTTGKFVLKPIRGGYDEGALLSLDESNVVSVEDPTRITFGELTNSVTVTYWDASTGKDGSVTVTDTALVQQQGAVINAPLQYPGFTNPRNATIAAQRDLKALSSPLLSCTVLADSSAKTLNIGDVFKFSWAKWGLANVIMRVTGISYGTGRNNRVKISCTQDVFDTDASVVVITTGGGWTDPAAPPSALQYEIALEAPYYELVQNLGAGNVDGPISSHPEIGYVVAAAGRPASAINANLHTDNGSGYEDVGTFDFCPAGRLAEDIDKLETSFSIEAFADLDQVTVGSHVQIGDELMRVDSIDDETGAMTVGRGVLDTVPEPHSEGDDVLFWDAFAGFDPTEYVEGETINAKITAATGSGVLPLDEATVLPVDIVGRAARPYPPGDLQVNAESYAEGAHYYGELAISWVHRDRLQQTSGTLIDHFDGTIGPEAGTLYRLQGYADNVLIHTEDDIDGNSTTWTPIYEGVTIKVEVHAKRDGIYSFQAPSHSFDYGGTPGAFLDNFDRANEDLEADAAWTRVGGTAGAAKVVSNALNFTSGTDATAYQAPNFGTADHYAQAKRPSASGAEWFLACRIQDGNNFVGARLASTDSGWAVYKRVGGTFTLLARYQMAATFKTNSIARLEVLGGNYQLIVDGVVLLTGAIGSHVDTATRAGFICRNDTGVNPAWDDFEHGILSEFTVPDARNVVLASFNGVDEATAFSNEAGAMSAFNFLGNAKLDDAIKTLGYTTSLALDGSGDYVTLASRVDHELATYEDFCVEGWLYRAASQTGLRGIIGKRSGGSVGWQLYLDAGVPRILLWGSSSIDANSSGGALSLTTWHHFALTREGSTVRLFINGTKVIEQTQTGSRSVGDTGLAIGRDSQNTGREFNGRIQEVRIRKGEAVYTADFTPPSSPFPR